ncbi:hypothetical protein ABKN59_007359 [Abortiporus biennis]
MPLQFQEPYSGKNPVPQIATNLASLVNPKRATAAKAKQVEDETTRNVKKDTRRVASDLAKGHAMSVTDPITGEELDIKNAEDYPNAGDQGENVLDTSFPPPDMTEHTTRVVSATRDSILVLTVSFAICFLFAQLFLYSHPFAYYTILIPPCIFSFILIKRIQNISKNDFGERIWHSERMRGLQAGANAGDDSNASDGERMKESAEWANTLLRGIWPIINPDLFSSLVDMIEDIMQASAPKFVHAVRIADLGLGTNAGRITTIRSLPDRDKDQQDGDVSRPESEKNEELEEDHVNLEVSFAYRGLPSGSTAQSKGDNLHLLVEFSVGIKGMYIVKVPVWVEITGVIGTARVRLQLISDPPFVKATLISLMGLPQITMDVALLSVSLPNVMDIPFVSGFISSSINTAAAEYVAPKSLTLDLQELISGDDIKKDTQAIGVLVVHIHRATGVKGMDADGGSADPIIKGDRNPVFEETAILLIDINTIRLRELLTFQLWDSDRLSVDDMLGIADIDICDLLRHRGRPIRRISTLSSPDSMERPGSIEYTVGYYGKLPPTSSLKTDGSDPDIPEDLREKPEFKSPKPTALNDLEKAVLVTPPDPKWPSGILSIQVHEIRDLKVRTEGRDKHMLGDGGIKQSATSSSDQTKKGQEDEGETAEEAEGLPSSYCEISLNDELVYKTRVKPITSTPMFNAGTERFVRDWRKAHIAVAVKDSRLRENDAILGVVMLKLPELLINASQLTRFYSLQQGLGYGRIRISILFRPVEAKLPPNLLGFDTGTLEVSDIIVKSEDKDMLSHLSKCQLSLKTTRSSSEEKIARKHTRTDPDGSIVWDSEDNKELPIRQRYGSALLVSFKDSSAFKSSRRKASGVFWLRDLVDSVHGQIEIPLWRAKNGDYSRLKLNYVSPDGDLKYWDSDKENVERIGSVILGLSFEPGISDKHKSMMSSSGPKQREAWEAFQREKDGGLRDTVGHMQERDDGAESKKPNHEKVTGSSAEEQTEEARKKSEGQTMSPGPLNAINGDGNAAEDDSKLLYGSNTVVSPDEASSVLSDGIQSNDANGKEDGSSDSDEVSVTKKRSGLVDKFKEWKHHEKELHRDHRGIKQLKPARTADWIKDNIEESAHAVKERFSMKSRKPDIETEV